MHFLMLHFALVKGIESERGSRLEVNIQVADKKYSYQKAVTPKDHIGQLIKGSLPHENI